MSDMKKPMSAKDQVLYLIEKAEAIDRIDLHIDVAFILRNVLDGETLLHAAVRYAKIEIIKLLIEAGLDVNTTNILGQNSLVLAIENESPRSMEIVEILYKANANVYRSDLNGKSAIVLVLIDCSCNNDEIIKFFLNIIYCECMKDSKKTSARLIYFRCPIWQVVLLGNPEVIEHMINSGQPINSCHYNKKFTALSKAVEHMDLKMVQDLIKYGADVDLRDIDNYHPIFYYGINIPGGIQRPEIIEILLAKSHFLKDVHKENVIYQFKTAFECGNKIVVQMLFNHCKDILNIRDGQGQTPLHYLSRNLHSDITEVLQGYKIDANVSDFMERTPLFIALESKVTHINTIEYLLNNGADVNYMSQYEDLSVPLFALCQNLSVPKNLYFKIVQMFLKHGLDIQFVGSDQTTVFDIILKTDSMYMAKPLLAHLAILDDLEKPILGNIYQKIDSDRRFKSCFYTCKVNLGEMKSCIVNDNLTLYTIIANQKNVKKVINCCRFDPHSIFNLERLKNEMHPFNQYYAAIQERISSIVQRLKLLQEAAPIICNFYVKLNDNPHHIVVTTILDYLRDEDLQTLKNVIL